MNDKNRILLVLDGSEASLHATQFAIRYARATKMEVVAQLVIDSGNLWKTIGSCTSGLIGSGPYVAAYEGAKKDLLEIAGFIEQSFSARADAAGIKTEFHIDEGEPLHEIDKRAADCSLIIVGDLAVSKSMIESSIGERLANRSPLPTLLIRQPIDDLKVAQFYVDSNCYEPGAMAHFIDLTEALNLERHIICVGNAGGMDRFVQKIRNDASERVKLHVAVRVVSEPEEVLEFVGESSADVLPMFSTRMQDDLAYTIAGVTPQFLAHRLPTAGIVFLPCRNKLPEALTAPLMTAKLPGNS